MGGPCSNVPEGPKLFDRLPTFIKNIPMYGDRVWIWLKTSRLMGNEIDRNRALSTHFRRYPNDNKWILNKEVTSLSTEKRSFKQAVQGLGVLQKIRSLWTSSQKKEP